MVEELQPDVVLITLGLDDMIKGVEPGDAAAGLESFITSLQAVNPDLTIFVAQIGPCNVPDTECVDAVPAFNDAIASFSDLSTDESLVFVVDMVTDFSLDGLRDGGWGMNDAGDEAVARRWMDGCLTRDGRVLTPPTRAQPGPASQRATRPYQAPMHPVSIVWPFADPLATVG